MQNVILKKELSMDELVIVSSEMERAKKSKALAYVLLIFLGTLGVHRFYLGHIGMGILNIVVFLFGLLLFGLPYLILWVIELILLSGAVDKINARKELELIHNIKMLRNRY
ncbi:TM2 domain-containing protein [Paenibacillus sp. SC116]|uniref:TM2 domain-containing protein n=1 Tax=Paenibacillus sp. SC116 TaxID=2968986 RepID=UPI00215A1883|nr:TM2 domain-containing protein [Paenibacillus sp. SC116]MCR8844242.1 TM2 domain-containing protein [Paenibacillus sp. SC116]